MGNHPDFEDSTIICEPIDLQSIPRNDRTYLFTANAWIDLEPYVLFRECPACNHPRILIWDGQQHLDSYVGHRVNLSC